MTSMGTRSIASALYRLLSGIWYLGAISVGLLALLMIVSFFVRPGSWSSFALEVGFSGFDVQQPGAVAEGNLTMLLPVALKADPATGIQDVRANVRFPVREAWFFSASLALLLAMFSVGLWMLTQLREVFHTLRDGQPFVAANATRIQRVGYGVIFSELIRAGAVFFWSYSASSVLADGSRYMPMADISAVDLIYGLVILIMAEVFREGFRLREEQSLTI